MSEAISSEALQRKVLTPDEFFRRQLAAAARDVLAWYPQIATHAAISGTHPETGAVWTAHGRRTGPGNVEVEVREGGLGRVPSERKA